MSNYSIKADLLKVKGAFVTNLKGKTSTKRCLVIPIDESGMYLGEKGVYLNLTAIEMREERYGDTHVLKQSLPKDVYCLAGFSDKIFDIMKYYESDKNALINKINTIEL